MYGLAVMLPISTQATSKNIDKILGETDAIDSSLRLMDILMDLHFFFLFRKEDVAGVV